MKTAERALRPVQRIRLLLWCIVQRFTYAPSSSTSLSCCQRGSAITIHTCTHIYTYIYTFSHKCTYIHTPPRIHTQIQLLHFHTPLFLAKTKHMLSTQSKYDRSSISIIVVTQSAGPNYGVRSAELILKSNFIPVPFDQSTMISKYYLETVQKRLCVMDFIMTGQNQLPGST